MHVTTPPSDADIRGAGFVLMGEPLAIDLANTVKLAVDPQLDLLGDDTRNAAFWSLERHRLPEPAGVPSLSESLALRSALQSLLSGIASGAAPEAWALERVNEVARRTRVTTELVPAESSVTTKPHWQASDVADIALSAVALSAIDFLTGPNAGRLRVCAAPHCSMMFVAMNAKRRWCTANGCGNRERVARHSRQQ
jgi:predicted RNA-binding Zn ribbon-like protein